MPSMPDAPRLPTTEIGGPPCGTNASRSRTGIEFDTTNRAPLRNRTHQGPDQRGTGEVAPVDRAGHGRGRGRLDASPGGEPIAGPGSTPRPGEGDRHGHVDVIGHGEAGVVPVTGRIDQHHPLGAVSLEPQPHRLGGRRSTDAHDHLRGQVGDGPRQEVVGGGDHHGVSGRAAATQLSQRLGDHGPTPGGRVGQDRLGVSVLGIEPDAVVGADDDHAALGTRDLVEHRGARPAPGAVDRGGHRMHRHRADRLERLPQWPVEMDRSGPLAGGGFDRSTPGDGGPLRAPVGGDREIGGPAGGGAVEPDLVDGLAGAPVAQLGWPIGRAHDHRYAGVVGFDHGRQVVGGRSTRRADQHCRSTGGPPDAEGEEPGGSLVELDPRVEGGLGVERDSERGRPGNRG